MKFLKNLALVTLGFIALMFVLFIITLVFVLPYMFITGEAPHVGLVNLWYLFVGVIVLSVDITYGE